MNICQALQEAEHAARMSAQHWGPQLSADDRAQLATAFHQAESLAHTAIATAISQVGPAYRAALEEQLEDETRHIDVFASWHSEPPEPVIPPKPRNRQEHVWFTTLLLNEIAGFCQFQMLAGLLHDAKQAQAIEEIIVDERVHIRRLAEWLRPLHGTPTYAQVLIMCTRFEKRMTGRMSQFLPRETLGGLREEMARTTSQLIARIFREHAEDDNPPGRLAS